MSEIVPPVTRLSRETQQGPEEGAALAVSGGGYRAMTFHLGAFLRLHELGILPQLKRISSVSGGSITAAKIALEWDKVRTRDDFFEHVVRPIRTLAGTTVDAPSVLGGVLFPGSVADRVSRAYARHLFGTATLQDLPDEPRFVINATNIETCSLFRFSKPYMADWRLGLVRNPTVSLAAAVTASSAFPPVLSPSVLHADREDFEQVPDGLNDPRLFEEISLTDGGVYDNLGLETVWKNYTTVLVSDAGARNALDPTPAADWPRHAKRVLDIIHEQVSNIRKRQVIASYQAPASDVNHRTGAYWGIRTDIAHYELGDAWPVPHARSLAIAETPTRLKRLSADLQERLINWGYAVCDAAIRKHWPPAGAQTPDQLPYPGTGI
ncbi:patatin-like phospholipase family protein [Sphingosinicella sp. YJ22]|uniref:patatin-like phospholipase family protein n=1 Tax=Sphingosinicella sp. YJ22 TaxID=1104780 RepID=UPI00140BA2E8|nr:patatin-like phospholipase family protein [Sphingosinicella sp. YJ22]